MDVDFHYYGTYAAACEAGYSPSEATLIAHAANYVDFQDASRLISKDGIHMDVDCLQTYQDLWSKLMDAPIEDSLWYATTTFERCVWVPFHFLPGNLELATPYEGPKEYSNAPLPPWHYNARTDWEMKLLCKADSELCTAIINDMTDASSTPDLYLIGIRMHVLADSGAHMYFAGTPSWPVNDCEDIWEILPNGNQKIEFQIFGSYERSPQGIYADSYCYTGHGRAGHVPDWPYIKYSYKPQWSAEWITKDNPTEFWNAFRRMVQAMQCVRNNTPYDVNSYTAISPEVETGVKNVIAVREQDPVKRCQAWINWLDATPWGLPPPFDKDAWKSAILATNDLPAAKQTDYYRFNTAATTHYNFVLSTLSDLGVSLEEPIRPIAIVVSEASKMHNQDHRSSGNFSMAWYGNTKKVRVDVRGDNVDGISFSIKLDVQDHKDKVIASGVKRGATLDWSIFTVDDDTRPAHMYIADPKGATGNFRVTLYPAS